MRYLLAFLLVFLTGCDEDTPRFGPALPSLPPVAGIAIPSAPPAGPATSTDLRKQLSEVEAARIALQERAATLEKQIKQKEKEEAEAETHRQQVFLRWFSGISIFLGAIAFGLSFALASTPGIQTLLRWGGVAISAIGMLCLIAAWVLPYAIWIGVLLVLVLVAWALRHMVKSDKATVQLAHAVNAVKEKIPEDVFKSLFRQYLDTDVDKHMDTVRGKHGL